MKPAKTLLQGKPYTNAAATDIRKTFERVRRELKKVSETTNVKPIRKAAP